MSKDSQEKVPESDILLLGCGLVAGPIIKYLNEQKYRIIIATRTASKGEKVQKECQNPELIHVSHLDLETRDHNLEKFEKCLDSLMVKCKVVISLLPYVYHPVAAQHAIKWKKHFCTTSYISDAMKQFDEPATKNDLLFLNECGVDPGLDHMEAARIIDDVNDKLNGQVIEFYSICGGLPTPSANDNPLGYKFSWAPKGVLLATNNNVKQLIKKDILAFEGKHLFDDEYVFDDHFDDEKIGDLEWYFNRDSTIYKDVYNIPHIQTLVRGTYRYPGWCETLRLLSGLGLTKSVNDIKTENKTYNEYFSEYLKVDSNVSIIDFICKQHKLTKENVSIKNLIYIGINDDKTKIPQKVNNTPIDILCHLLLQKLVYKPNEKDMIVMKHSFEILYPKDGWRETRTSTMIDFGLQGNKDGSNDSSMSRTVSLPLAIAIESLLKGDLKIRGLHRPVKAEFYNLVLPKLEKQFNIGFKDETLSQLIWLRDEIKPGERRVCIIPCDCKKLLDNGFRVTVERSKNRIFKDKEYEELGCKMVDSRSWQTDAPHSAWIVGLKELPEPQPLSLSHRHIFFAHCYKNQDGAKALFERFKDGNGEIYDLEFIVDPKTQRRIAAFGFAAGMCGMGVGIIKYVKQQLLLSDDKNNNNDENDMKELNTVCDIWESKEDMIKNCKNELEKLKSVNKPMPNVIIIGAKGRCGSGAVWTAKECGLAKENITEWDLEETSAKPGPYKEIAENNDIFVNCIRLLEKIPPFIDQDTINNADKENQRKLTMIVDVACDPNNPNNPIPVYDEITTMFEPVRRVTKSEKDKKILPLDVIAIDHLPSLVPREASVGFSNDLIDTVMTLKDRDNVVWNNVRKLFYSKMKETLAAPSKDDQKE